MVAHACKTSADEENHKFEAGLGLQCERHCPKKKWGGKSREVKKRGKKKKKEKKRYDIWGTVPSKCQASEAKAYSVSNGTETCRGKQSGDRQSGVSGSQLLSAH